MAIEFEIQDSNSLEFDFSDPQSLEFGTRDIIEVRQSGDYLDLTNKPSINGVTLIGDKTTEDLGIEVGVTSWNGQTGDVVYTPPNYALTYDESVSVGSAVVGEAVTGEPNYTPSGTVTATVTTKAETFLSGGTVQFSPYYSNYRLYFNTPTFSPTTTTKNIVTSIENLTFNGNGVKFAVEQEQ